jgi:hypothetical protein
MPHLSVPHILIDTLGRKERATKKSFNTLEEGVERMPYSKIL